MPTNFTQTLSDPPGVDMTRRDIVQDDSLEALGGALQSLGEFAGEYRDDRVLENLQGATAGVLGEVAEFKKTERNMREALSVSDSATMEMINKEMYRLRNGEIQGRMSPLDAHVKLRTLVNEKVRRFPHLAEEIKSLHTGMTEGINRIVTEAERGDPISDAQAEILKYAELHSISPFEARQKMQADFRVEQAKQDREIAEEAGVLGEFQIRVEAEAQIQSIVTDFYLALKESHKTGKLVSRDELLAIASTASQVRAGIRTSLSAKRREALASGGRLDFRPEFDDELEAMVDKEFKFLTELAGSLDSEEAQTRTLEMLARRQEATDVTTLNRIMGPYAPLLRLPGGPQLVDSLIGFEFQTNKGQAANIRTAAEAGDPRAQIFVRMVETGFLGETLSKDAIAVLSGQPVAATPGENTQEFDKARAAAAWRTAVDVKVPADTRVKYLEYFINSGDGLFGSNYNRALRDPKTRQMIVQHPNLITAVKKRIGADVAGAVNELSDPQAQGWVLYNETAKRFEVPLLTPGPSGVVRTDEVFQQAMSAVIKLNQALSATTVIGEDRDAFVQEAFERIAGKRKLASIEDLRAEDGPTPNNRKGTIAREGTSDEKEDLYMQTFNEYFDTTNPMRPKLKEGKTAKQAEEALRKLGF